MTCKQLGGACDKRFFGISFAEISQLSQEHGLRMVQLGDKPHIEAMKKMHQILESSEKMKQWFEMKRREFHNKYYSHQDLF